MYLRATYKERSRAGIQPMNFIDVKTDFGAVGNGVADDTDALQSAMDAGTGPVYVPKGTYKCNTLEIPSNCRIQGAGRGLSFIKAGASVTGTTPLFRNKAAARTAHTYTYRTVMSDLSLQQTDGNGGTALLIDGFREAHFDRLDIDMFRNAGNQGKGIYVTSSTLNVAYNGFSSVHVRNCDDAVTFAQTDATYSIQGNLFHGLFIEGEVNGLQLLATPGRLPGGNHFFGLIIQGGGGNGAYGTTYAVRCDGSGNTIEGFLMDGGLYTYNLAFTDAGAGANLVTLSGLDQAKYLNSQSTGVPNVVITGTNNFGSPGKPYMLYDSVGSLVQKLKGGPHPANVEQWIGNAANEDAYKWTWDAAAGTYVLTNDTFTVLELAKAYMKFWAGHPGHVERMRLTDGGLAVEPAGVSADIAASAALELRSTAKGFLPPRMTTAQRTAIASPADGLVVYDTDLHKLFVRENTTWVQK